MAYGLQYSIIHLLPFVVNSFIFYIRLNVQHLINSKIFEINSFEFSLSDLYEAISPEVNNGIILYLFQ